MKEIVGLNNKSKIIKTSYTQYQYWKSSKLFGRVRFVYTLINITSMTLKINSLSLKRIMKFFA